VLDVADVPGAELARGDLLRPPAHSLGDVGRIEAEWPPLDVDSADDDVDVRVVGVVVIDGTPHDAPPEVSLDLLHQLAGVEAEIELGPVLGGHDEAELVRLLGQLLRQVLRPEGPALSAIELALGAVALDAIPLDVGQVQARGTDSTARHRHDARLDDAPTGHRRGLGPVPARGGPAPVPRCRAPLDSGDAPDALLDLRDHRAAERWHALGLDLASAPADARPEGRGPGI
jgi:hypothetical protein